MIHTDAPSDALEVYARALHCAPSEDFPPNAPLLNNVATILLQTGQRDLATFSLERSLEIEPHAPGTLFNLATAKYGAALDAFSPSTPGWAPRPRSCATAPPSCRNWPTG